MHGAPLLDYDRSVNKGFKLIQEGGNRKNFGLLLVAASNLGLRVTDLLDLSYDQLRQDRVIIKEGKTGKSRELTINSTIHRAMQYFPKDNGYAFTSAKGGPYSRQQVNRILKFYFKGDKKISSHSLRKGFGRKIYENAGETENGLILLGDIFNHTNLKVTRGYLGITRDEISNAYNLL